MAREGSQDLANSPRHATSWRSYEHGSRAETHVVVAHARIAVVRLVVHDWMPRSPSRRKHKAHASAPSAAGVVDREWPDQSIGTLSPHI